MNLQLRVSRLLPLCLLVLITYGIQAQVGINTTAPAPSSMLDIESSNKGILIPRVNISDLNSISPVTGGSSESLLVYNTNTTTGKGFYYWDTTKWVAMSPAEKNIYTDDGILQANRTVTQNDKTLEFNGNIGRNAISIKRTDNVTETGLSFRNSGNAYDASIFMETGSSSGLAISAGGNETTAGNLLPNTIFNDDQTTSFSKELKIYEGNANTNDITSRLYSNSDDGILDLNENNTFNHRINANGATIFNNKQLNLDFRVAGDNNANTLFVKGSNDRIGIKTNNPQKELHIAGNTATARIDGLSNANNTYNVVADPAPVYVDNNGDLTLQPPLIQTFMPVNLVDFINPAILVTSTNGAGVSGNIRTETINLTQESLVHVSYQFSVQITRSNGSALTDGAARLFRAGVLVDADPIHLGYSTGTYTNNPDVDATNSIYASGYYYLSGSGYVQLPAGSHTFTLDFLGFGASYDFQMTLGETNQDRFQIVVHR